MIVISRVSMYMPDALNARYERSFARRKRALSAPNRSISSASFPNEFTTRMPETLSSTRAFTLAMLANICVAARFSFMLKYAIIHTSTGTTANIMSDSSQFTVHTMPKAPANVISAINKSSGP